MGRHKNVFYGAVQFMSIAELKCVDHFCDKHLGVLLTCHTLTHMIRSIKLQATGLLARSRYVISINLYPTYINENFYAYIYNP